MKRSPLSVSLFALSVTAFSPGPILAEKHFEGIPRFRDTPGDGDGSLGFEILDAPEGVTLVAQPDAAAPVLKRFEEPGFVRVIRYVESGGARFYLPKEAIDEKTYAQREVGWIVVPGPGRRDFIAGTKPARLLKKEQRDDPKLGPVNAEVYEETVPVAEANTWGDGFRRAEIDFAFPVKVVSFGGGGDGSWEAVFTVFPAFNSDVGRIPGPEPEFYDDPYRALITMPDRREVTLRGSARLDEYRSLLVPGTVWAAGMSEGRIQCLSIGYSWLPPEIECSPLSNPAIRRGDRLDFRFRAAKLDGTFVTLDATPDRILGIDYTNYDVLAKLRPEPPDPEFPQSETWAEEWNILLNSRHEIVVVAPLMEGRGAAGMLELESLDLGDTYEQDLKALRAFWDVAPPEFTSAEPGWALYTEEPMGAIPASQQAGRDATTQNRAAVMPAQPAPARGDPRYAFLSERLVDQEELADWTYARLRYAVNYLYALQGYPFVTKEGVAIREVFGQYEWYDPIPGLTAEEAEQTMSAIEAENIKTLAAERNRKKP